MNEQRLKKMNEEVENRIRKIEQEEIKISQKIKKNEMTLHTIIQSVDFHSKK
jgi:hypothetical protein